MNKVELIAKIAEKEEGTKKAAAEHLDAVISAIEEALALGEEIKIAGFGKFEVKERAEREGRNPATNQPMLIPATKTPKFKAGKALKDAVNEA